MFIRQQPLCGCAGKMLIEADWGEYVTFAVCADSLVAYIFWSGLKLNHVAPLIFSAGHMKCSYYLCTLPKFAVK